MSKQNQAAENEQKKQSQQINKPAATAEQTVEEVTSPELSKSLIGGAGDTPNQALHALLGGRRFLTAQRQAMTTQIGQVGGNQYLQRVMAQMQEHRGSESDIPSQTYPLNRSLNAQAIVQRDEPSDTTSDGDSAWATSTKAPLERIQDAILDAVTRLNTDGTAAIRHIRAAQGTYDSFDTMYERAVGLFVGGVAAAQAKQEEFRQNVKFVATALLASQAPLVSVMYLAMDGVLTKVEGVGRLVNAASTVRTPSSAPGGSSPAMAARRENRVQWSQLLSTTLTSYENSLKTNSTLNSGSRSCVDILRFLNNVQDGRYTGDNPRSSTLGLHATRMADGVTSIMTNLTSITSGTVSAPTEVLATQIAGRLSGITVNKLQQDIAIRWIAGLGDNKLDEIDTAEAYLKKIGVIDAEGNRLGYDTGWITTDIDERIIHWRAEWEDLAMRLVGSTVAWLGTRMPLPPAIDTRTRCIEPRAYSGIVRDSRNREWNVNIPRGVTTSEGGGQILLTSYRIDHRDSSGWEWSYPAALRQQLKYEVKFIGQPLGELGGGAPRAGPVINAPE